MLSDIVKDYNYKDIMEENLKDIINYLIDKEENFSILCNLSALEFSPEIPEDIYSNFKPFTLFVLAGYTFSTIKLDEEILSFEAGFGPNNFGSVVNVPFFAIFQIIVEDNVLFINLTAGSEEFKKKKEEKVGIENSMEALLSNPENSKFKKK